MPRIEILFYPGEGIAALLVRLWTRSRFAHVAVRVDDTVYEALAPRVIRRAFNAATNDARAVAVALPADCDVSAHGAQMIAFLNGAVGDRYDWRAIGLDFMAPFTPPWVHLIDASRSNWDCSRFAATALGVLGWDDAACRALFAPISPGDLYRMLIRSGRKDSKPNV